MNISKMPTRTDRWSGVLYACQSGENGPVKIGYTTVAAASRVTALQQSSPWKLFLLAEWSGHPQEELAHHIALADHRIRGEWYWPTRMVLDRIAGAVAAAALRAAEIRDDRLAIGGPRFMPPVISHILRPDVFGPAPEVAA